MTDFEKVISDLNPEWRALIPQPWTAQEIFATVEREGRSTDQGQPRTRIPFQQTLHHVVIQL